MGLDEAAFAKNMKLLREARGMSQEDLVARLNGQINQSAISRIEQGKRPVRLGEARRIAGAFGRTIFEMLVDADSPVVVPLHMAETTTARAEKSIRQLREAAEKAFAWQKAVRLNLETFSEHVREDPVDDIEFQKKRAKLLTRMGRLEALDLLAEVKAISEDAKPIGPDAREHKRVWYVGSTDPAVRIRGPRAGDESDG